MQSTGLCYGVLTGRSRAADEKKRSESNNTTTLSKSITDPGKPPQIPALSS